jgi:NACHT, LRR and PYD domains-containing protein 3
MDMRTAARGRGSLYHAKEKKRTHSLLPNLYTNLNAYELGKLDGHYIVILCFLASIYRIVAAVNVVSCIYLTFSQL